MHFQLARNNRIKSTVFIIFLLAFLIINPSIVYATSPHSEKILNSSVEIASPSNNQIVDATKIDIDVNYSAAKLQISGGESKNDDKDQKTHYIGHVKSILLYMNGDLVGSVSLSHEDSFVGTYTFTENLSQFKDFDEVTFQAFSYEVDIADILNRLGKSKFTKNIAQEVLKNISTSAQSSKVIVSILRGVGTIKQPNPKYLVTSPDGEQYPVNQLLLQLKDTATQSDLDAMLQKINGEIVGEIQEINLYQIEIPATTVQEQDNIINFLLSNPQVDTVTRNNEVSYSSVDTDLGRLVVSNPDDIKAYDKIRVREAWDDIGTFNKQPKLNYVVIGVVDSGVDENHQEFQGVNLGTLKNLLVDYASDGHGTSVTGIIGGNNWIADNPYRGAEMNGIISGIPNIHENYRLEVWPWQSPVIGFINSISNAVKKGSNVVNLSLGVRKCSSLSLVQKILPCASDKNFNNDTKILKDLFSKHPNVLFVISAGNDGVDSSNTTPANVILDNTITVGATNLDDKRAIWLPLGLQESDYGSNVLLSAPGVGVYAPKLGGGYGFFSGTSASAPLVTGVTGMLIALDPNAQILSQPTASAAAEIKRIKNILIDSADQVMTDKPVGKRLNAEKAVCEVINCKSNSTLQNVSVPGAVVTDGSWKYSQTEQTGWQNSEFDDSSWSPVVSPSSGGCGLSDGAGGLTPLIAAHGGHNIWGINVGAGAFDYFRKSFNLTNFSSTNDDAFLIGGIDDDGEVYINGTQVVTDHDGFASEFNTINVNQYITQGENTISVHAYDTAGGCQFFHLLLLLSPKTIEAN